MTARETTATATGVRGQDGQSRSDGFRVSEREKIKPRNTTTTTLDTQLDKCVAWHIHSPRACAACMQHADPHSWPTHGPLTAECNPMLDPARRSIPCPPTTLLVLVAATGARRERREQRAHTTLLLALLAERLGSRRLRHSRARRLRLPALRPGPSRSRRRPVRLGLLSRRPRVWSGRGLRRGHGLLLRCLGGLRLGRRRELLLLGLCLCRWRCLAASRLCLLLYRRPLSYLRRKTHMVVGRRRGHPPKARQAGNKRGGQGRVGVGVGVGVGVVG